MKPAFVRQLALVSFATILLMSYQNCGRIGFNAEKGSLAGLAGMGSEVCDGLLKQVYTNTYFPMLSTSCNRCHSNAHGSSDLETSFRAFQSKGVPIIDYKATNPHGDNGLDMTVQIASFKAQWNEGEAQYNQCLAGSGLGNVLSVNPKTVPDIAQTIANQNSWKTVEWDLENDVPDAQKGRFKALFRIEARMSLNQGLMVGMDFRNPSMKLKASNGSFVRVDGLSLNIDGDVMSNVNMYDNLSATAIDAANFTNMAPGSGVALAYLPAVTVNMPVSVQFKSIRMTTEDGTSPTTTLPSTPTGPPVTWTQLTSTDPMLGVFTSRCVSCHTGPAAPKGLDLTNYTISRDASAAILMRVNSSAMPMPPTGLLPAAEREVIGRWISNGSAN